METEITKGIKVSVEPFYMPQESIPIRQQYAFAYRVVIENQSDETVQLLRRHWFIFDSNGMKREVEGEGVIGQQPILKPGDHHQYSSWCPLKTPIGKMYGTFLMKKTISNKLFKVAVPHFQLIAPFVAN